MEQGEVKLIKVDTVLLRIVESTEERLCKVLWKAITIHLQELEETAFINDTALLADLIEYLLFVQWLAGKRATRQVELSDK